MANDPEAITRAILSGALAKANDAVHADGIGEYSYAVEAYIASCELLAQVMGRTETGGEHWNKINAIVCFPANLIIMVANKGSLRRGRRMYGE